MARRFSCGWEWNTTNECAGNVVGAATVVTTTVRSGTYALQAAASAGEAQLNVAPLFSAGDALGTTYYVRFYFRLASFQASQTVEVGRVEYTGGNGVCFLVSSAGVTELRAITAGTTYTSVGTGPTVSTGTWYMGELAVSCGTGAVDYGEARLDGTSFASSSTLSITDSAPGMIVRLGSFGVGHTSTHTVFIDDVACNDGSGASQNSWPGSGKLVLLKPTSDNARVGYVTGAAGTTSLFDAVNNLPPTGAATGTATNRIHSPTNNATDTYDANLTTYTTAGVAGTDQVNVVDLHANVGGATTTVANQALQMISNPVIAEGTSIAKPSAAWGTFPTNWAWGFSNIRAYTPTVTLGTAPVMRIRRATANANQVGADAMGAYVDYGPAPAVTPPRTKTVVQQAVQRAANW